MKIISFILILFVIIKVKAFPEPLMPIYELNKTIGRLKTILFTVDKNCTNYKNYTVVDHHVFAAASYFMTEKEKIYYFDNYLKIYFDFRYRYPKKCLYLNKFLLDVVRVGIKSSCYFNNDIKYFKNYEQKIIMYSNFKCKNKKYVLYYNFIANSHIRALYKEPNEYWKFY